MIFNFFYLLSYEHSGFRDFMQLVRISRQKMDDNNGAEEMRVNRRLGNDSTKPNGNLRSLSVNN